MTDRASADGAERRVVAVTLLAAGSVCLGHAVLWDVVRHDAGGFVEAPGDLVKVGSEDKDLFRLALFADLIGCYLLHLPAVVYLRNLLRRHSPWAHDLAAAGGAVFVAAGSAGAAIWATAGTDLIAVHSEGGSAAQDAARAFEVIADMVVNGLWQTIAAAGGALWFGILAAAWWPARRWFAGFTALLAVAAGTSVIAQAVGLEVTQRGGPSSPGLAVAAVWPLWLGVILWRGPVFPDDAPP